MVRQTGLFAEHSEPGIGQHRDRNLVGSNVKHVLSVPVARKPTILNPCDPVTNLTSNCDELIDHALHIHNRDRIVGPRGAD